MEGQDIRGLMEAYSQVYETPEVLNEEVEQIDEAPMTAFQAAGGNAKLAQLNKNRSPRAGRVTAADLEKQGQENLFKAGGGQAAIDKGPKRNAGRGGMRPTLTRQDIINRGTVAAAKPAKPQVSNIPPKEGTGKGGPSDIRRTPTPAAPTKPSGTPAAKPAATSAPKPTPAPAKPAGSAMDQWAKANPKLAAAKAERDRTRGTSATTNPLMKDMKDRLPAPKSPAPSTAKTGFDLAKKGVNLAAGVDIFDLVKGHLLDEGYAETEENALVMMANMSEEWRQSIINEISKELATKAFATRARDAFEMDDIKQHDKADKTKERIVKKHGKEAGDEAEKAAERAIYGHNKYSEAQEREKEKKKSMKKEEVEINEKMEKWIQKVIDEGRYTSLQALSRESEKRKADKERGRPETESEVHGRLMMGKFRPGASKEERAEGGRQRLKDRGKVPKKGGKDMFEEVLEYLVAEGYADTEEAAIAIMANMGEEWMENIINENILQGAQKMVGSAVQDVKNRLTGKKELVGGKHGYIKVGSPTKTGDSRVSGIGPVGTYARQDSFVSKASTPAQKRTMSAG